MTKPKISDKLMKAFNYSKPENKFSKGMHWAKLKSGGYGAIFNDGTEILVAQDLFQLQIRNNSEFWQLFNFSEYPEEHKEKVYLIGYMLNLFQSKSVKLSQWRPNNHDENFLSIYENTDLMKLKLGKH